MRLAKTALLGGLLGIPATCVALISQDAIKSVAPDGRDIAVWGIGLVVVLSIFLLGVWGVSRISGSRTAQRMRVVDGLSLGLREKVMLLQVGKKQLVLGVTPGRIETLYVLEGEDCLQRDEIGPFMNANGFAQKLLQAMKARANA